jgi:nitrogen fixation/metabolism regulation signal transduction histidine kinase
MQVQVTEQSHAYHRFGEGWPARALEPSTCNLGKDPRIVRQAVYGAALASATSGLSRQNDLLHLFQGQLRERLEAGDLVGVRSVLDVQDRAVQRLQRMYGDLQDFASGAPVRTEPVTVAEVMRIVTYIGRLVDTDVGFSVESVCSNLSMLVNPHHLEQVLGSVVKNAEQAVQAKHGRSDSERKIVVRVHPLMRTSDHLSLSGIERSRPYLGVTVFDTGEGMSGEELTRIAEPYFTTRRFGGGTGLGLFIATVLVEANGGYLVVRSEKRVGTLVTLSFPVSPLP